MWCIHVRANWWTERWLKLWVSLSFYLSPSPSLCVSLPLSHYLSIHPSINLPTNLSTYLPTYLSIHLSIYLKVTRLPPKMSSTVPHLPSFWNCCKTHTFDSLLTKCRIYCPCHNKRPLNLQNLVRRCGVLPFWPPKALHATAACAFCRAQLRKLFRPWGAFTILTSKSVSRHIRFVNMSTSKSVPKL